MIVHGIPNCDTVKRARAWLAERGVAHSFHDFKKAGVPAEGLDAWMKACGWETVLNRRGNTWRALDAATQQQVVDAESARRLMPAQPSVIKRPVVAWPNGSITVGFDEQDFSRRTAR